MRELTPTELDLEKLPWELKHKGGHYPVWIGLHRLACRKDHLHQPGKCCLPECWCQQEPLKILGGGSGDAKTPRTISHLPHPLCERESYHPYLECTACCDKDGPHPIVVMYPGAGKPYTSSLMEPKDRGPRPKAEDRRPETDLVADLERSRQG
jgi:hypothetical protein